MLAGLKVVALRQPACGVEFICFDGNVVYRLGDQVPSCIIRILLVFTLCTGSKSEKSESKKWC